MAYRSTVTAPPAFADDSDAEQVKELSENIPFRWRNGGRDSVESFGKLLGATRDHELYLKVGCSSWKAYCDKFLSDPSEAFDELIDGVEILRSRGHRGKISEKEARNARREQAKEIARIVKPMPEQARGIVGGKAGPGRGRKTGDNITRFARGTSAEYRASVLRRDHPDIADRMAAGEFRSVREAERAAGIVAASVPSVPLTDPKAVTRKLIAQGDDFASEVMEGLRAYFSVKGRG